MNAHPSKTMLTQWCRRNKLWERSWARANTGAWRESGRSWRHRRWKNRHLPWLSSTGTETCFFCQILYWSTVHLIEVYMQLQRFVSFTVNCLSSVPLFGVSHAFSFWYLQTKCSPSFYVPEKKEMNLLDMTFWLTDFSYANYAKIMDINLQKEMVRRNLKFFTQTSVLLQDMMTRFATIDQ